MITKSDSSAWLMKCLVPLIRQPSPSRVAFVRIPRRSEPAPGSVIAMQSRRSPRTQGRRYLSFCASVPASRMFEGLPTAECSA